MNSVYSPSEKAIYPSSFYDAYISAGTWPKDGIDISDDDAEKYSGANQPTGKMLGYIDNSLSWVDLPSPTAEEEVASAVAYKTSLLSQITFKTQIWQTQLVLGIITDADKAELTAWMKYAQAVSAIDTSTAPNITWPTAPVT